MIKMTFHYTFRRITLIFIGTIHSFISRAFNVLKTPENVLVQVKLNLLVVIFLTT